MSKVIPILRFPRSPLVDEPTDQSSELTGTLMMVDDYLDNLIEQLAARPLLSERQVELIDTMNTKIMAFQLIGSTLLPHGRGTLQTTGDE